MSTGLLTISTTAEECLLHNLINDFVNDFYVSLQQIEARLAGALLGAGGNHDQVRIGKILRLAFTDLHGGEECLPMRQIEHLPLGQITIVIP
jgi:hypothetical protein